MAKINEIVINGFKAFPSLYKIELGGKHLLMYGENGSGKSSIYYALHCIFNSYRKPDKGKKYFDKSNSQNLVNRFFSQKNALDKPHVAINWSDRDGGPFSSKVFEISKISLQNKSYHIINLVSTNQISKIHK